MTGAMILFGSSLFFLHALPKAGPGSAMALRWARPLLMGSAVTILAGSVLGLLAQTIVLAGSPRDGLGIEALGAALTGMSFGKSSLARAMAALVFIGAFAAVKPSRAGWRMAALAGGVICASFAWMGHGAATKGAAGVIHLFSDIIHTLAAGVWIGALLVFLILSATDARQSAPGREALHRALEGFSGIGSALVAILLATGVANGGFVIGTAGLPRLWTSAYGQLLTVKVALFVVMVGLAAANRFRLTPRLAAVLRENGPSRGAIAALSRSLAWESGISIAVLALVAWFGMLEPPSAS